MRINHNIAALNTYRQLSSNGVNSSKSLEKLSSGLRINKAGDDAAGLAISEKMRGQIRGLDQATRNSQDAISLIQTAEGALNETHSILQRMRELAVQAANDTSTPEDRSKIQDEMDQLKQEIDRVANNTEFNQKTLLNGSVSKLVSDTGNQAAKFGNYMTSSSTAEGVYTLQYTSAATAGKIDATAVSLDATAITQANVATATIGTATAGAGGSVILVNGEAVTVNATDTLANVVTKINNLTASTGITASTGGGSQTGGGAVSAIKLTTTTLGTDATVQISGAGAILDRLGLRADADANTVISDAGTNAVATLSGATMTKSVGNIVTFSNGLTVTGDSTVVNNDNTTVTVSKGGTLSFQIGANENQSLEMSINKMDAKSLGVEGATTTSAVAVSSYATAKSAITVIDNAISTVSGERAKLGAYQNRLEHTIANLGTSSENLSAAESRIRDVDMAKEMMEFTKNNILSQAAQAMLAQANQQPQGVLQLLR